jgi:hypothetical protein
MQLKLSHHDEHTSHAPSDVLAMATLIVALLAIGLLIGASLSTTKISRDTMPASVQRTS